jgi:hypothetical protein
MRCDGQERCLGGLEMYLIELSLTGVELNGKLITYVISRLKNYLTLNRKSPPQLWL